MTSAESGDADSDSPVDETESGADATEEEGQYAIVLDHLPHGRPDDDRPRYKKSPLAYALGEQNFRLFELRLTDDSDTSIGDTVVLFPAEKREAVEELREVEYDDLSNTAHSELEYVVEDIITENERRFVDFYNDAQPITLRLHQLNLLPGIGKKLRNNVLDERKRGPFESFEDIEERVSGLHHARDVLVERVMEELRDDDLKYKTFVGRDD
jgi:putative nucleotide binding protein